ncbi:MAG: hypothetical protein RMI83_03885 [Desulfurococcaceae archaeon]|nr:hypothetical protein [Sulfolobales archaeon]MDW8170228.1 hypothetical protein [Desulfurococcaceae archaeon]
MPHLAEEIAGLLEKAGSSEFAQRIARLKLRELIASGSPLTRGLIEYYLRKAHRVGAWRRLPAVSRALLRACRFLPLVKSRVLRNILLELMIDIELYTTRGKAVYYGVLYAFRQGMLEALGSFKQLIALGISYMNLPSWLKILG